MIPIRPITTQFEFYGELLLVFQNLGPPTQQTKTTIKYNPINRHIYFLVIYLIYRVVLSSIIYKYFINNIVLYRKGSKKSSTPPHHHHLY
jgi:hypothetical protein